MSERESVLWCVADTPAGQPVMPEWLRSAAMDQKGRIYVPAAIGGNENIVFFKVAYDGVPVVTSDDHLYVPIDWLIKEYPKERGDLEHIRMRVMDAFSQHPERPAV